MIACAKNCCGPIAREALNRMMSAAVKVAGGAPQRDDMTLTVIRVLAGPMLSISIGKIFRDKHRICVRC